MLVVRHDSPIHLLDRARDFLHAAEAENNLILGICSRLAGQIPDDSPPPWLLSIEEGGAVAGVAVLTPPRKLAITRLSENGVVALVDFLSASAAPVPGIAGPSPCTSDFAQWWVERTGRSRVRHMRQRIYACRSVLPLPTAKGRLRPATTEDRPLLVDWFYDFHIAVNCEDVNDRCAPIVDAKLAEGCLVIWDDDGPCCCASFDRKTEHGVAINYVYTPPAKRRRGYATSCVAVLTQQQLDAGRAFCCLYTDLANPTSNHVYQRIGYRPVSDAEMWDFGAA